MQMLSGLETTADSLPEDFIRNVDLLCSAATSSVNVAYSGIIHRTPPKRL